MTDPGSAIRTTVGLGRIGTVAAWVSAVCCLPYLIIKTVWTLGIPLGIADRSIMDKPGWMAGNLFMALVELAAVGLVVAVTRPWALRLPAWLLLFPAWVGTGLLFQITVSAVLIGLTASVGGATGTTSGGLHSWVFILVYTGFIGQGAALATAFACHLRLRWGHLLTLPTAAPLGRLHPPTRATVTGTAGAAAALAVGASCLFGCWAAGGDYGLAGGSPQLPWGNLAGKAAGSIILGVAMLALTTGWGRNLWTPAALAWLGSGALVSDALFFLPGQLPALRATAPEWGLLETTQLVGAVVGLLAATLVVVLVRSGQQSSEVP